MNYMYPSVFAHVCMAARAYPGLGRVRYCDLAFVFLFA